MELLDDEAPEQDEPTDHKGLPALDHADMAQGLVDLRASMAMITWPSEASLRRDWLHMSTGGHLVVHSAPPYPPDGLRMEILLMLPDGIPVQTRGEVITHRAGGFQIALELPAILSSRMSALGAPT